MGEEWAASTPFLFFCDYGGELAESVREGRRAEFARFAAFQSPDARAPIPDPTAFETFLKSRLDWSERERAPHRETLAFYRALLAIRAREIVPRLKGLRESAAGFKIAGRGGLHAHWTLADGSRLVLRANLSGEPADAIFEAAEGRALCATHPEPAVAGTGTLPAVVGRMVSEGTAVTSDARRTCPQPRDCRLLSRRRTAASRPCRTRPSVRS